MSRRPIFSAVSFAVLTLMASTAAFADDATTPAAKLPPTETPATQKTIDPHGILVFNNLIASGSTPNYMGFDKHMGLHVWYTRMKDNAPVILYTTPSGQGMIAPGTNSDGQAVIGGDYWVVRDGKMVNLTYEYYTMAKTILATQGVSPPPTPTPPTPVAATSAPTTPSVAPAAEGGASRPQGASSLSVSSGTPAAPPPLAQPAPSLSGTSMLAAFEKAHWIEAGKPTAPLIYAVVDPECPHCHEFWQAIRPHIDRGEIRVRLIVVAILDNENLSVRSAADILSADNSLTAWNDHLSGLATHPSANGASAMQGASYLRDNEVMWKNTLYDNKLGGTPLILSRNKTGKLGYRLGLDVEKVNTLIQDTIALEPFLGQ